MGPFIIFTLAIVAIFWKTIKEDVRSHGLLMFLAELAIFAIFGLFCFAKVAKTERALDLGPALLFTKDGRQNFAECAKPGLKMVARDMRMTTGFYESEEEMDALDEKVKTYIRLADPRHEYTFEEALIELGYSPEDAKDLADALKEGAKNAQEDGDSIVSSMK